jgi:hypothetical protein
LDGIKALSNKVGGRRLSRPNEIAVPEVRYVSDVVTRWRRHPPEIGITILLPNMNLFHQALLLVSGDFGTSRFCWQFFDKETTLSPKSLTRIAPDQCVSSPE